MNNAIAGRRPPLRSLFRAKPLAIAGLIPLLVAVRANAQSEQIKEAMVQLEAAIAEESKASAADDQGRPERSEVRRHLLAQLKNLIGKPDADRNLDQTLIQLSSSFRSAAVQQNIDLLQQALAAEQIAQNQATIGGVEQLLARAGTAVREAKAASDLDAVIAELGQARHGGDRAFSDEKVRRVFARIEPTLQSVVLWQNYLAAEANKNSTAAREALQTLSNANQVALIPRSEILLLLARPVPNKSVTDVPDVPSPSKSIEAVLVSLKSLEDVAGAVSSLRQLLDTPRLSAPSSAPLEDAARLVQVLATIDRTFQDHKAGLPTTFELNVNYGDGLRIGNETVAALKAQLLMQLIPRYIGAPDQTRPNPGEDVITFLDRLVNEAKSRGDMNVCLRARETLRLLQRSSSFTGGDLSGLSAFVAARNQEAAGQFMLAVASYQSALKSGSDLIPAKLIGERLAAIKSEHPADFDAGMELFLNPRVPSSSSPQGNTRGTASPGGAGTTTGEPRGAALLIPPAPVPAATPAAK